MITLSVSQLKAENPQSLIGLKVARPPEPADQSAPTLTTRGGTGAGGFGHNRAPARSTAKGSAPGRYRQIYPLCASAQKSLIRVGRLQSEGLHRRRNEPVADRGDTGRYGALDLCDAEWMIH